MDRTHRSRHPALFVTAILLLITAFAAAQEPNAGLNQGVGLKLGLITADDVYVRSGPGDSYYPFGKVGRNDVVKVIGEKFNWTRVVTVGPAFDEFFGYVRLPKTDTSRLEIAPDGKTALVLGRLDVLAPNLNSKHNPDHSWKRIAELDAKMTVGIGERIETDRAIVYRIALPTTAEGWISSTFIGEPAASQIAAWKKAVAGTTTMVAATDPNAAKKMTTPIPERKTVRPTPIEVADAATSGDVRPLPRKEELLDPPVATATPALAPAPAVTSAPVFEVDSVVGTTTDDDDDWHTAPQEWYDTSQNVTGTDADALANTPEITDRDPANGGYVIENDNVERSNESLVSTYYNDTRYPRVIATIPTTPTIEPQAFEAPAVEATSDTVVSEQRRPAQPVIIGEVIVRPAVPMTFASAQNRLSDLEAAYRRLKDEPITAAEVLPLRTMYIELGSDAAAHDSIGRYAVARAEQLTIWAELQSRRLELNRLREQLSTTAQETRSRLESAQEGGLYVAVGRLTKSTIFDGARLPQLYRIQDARSGRSLGYLRPDPRLGLENLVGQFVGVSGRAGFDETLKVELLTPARVDRLSTPEG